MQVVDNKKRRDFRALDQGPSIKDLNIEKRFRKLKNFNEGCNNDDDDNDNHQEVIYHCCNIRHHHLEEMNHHFHLHCQFRQRNFKCDAKIPSSSVNSSRNNRSRISCYNAAKKNSLR